MTALSYWKTLHNPDSLHRDVLVISMPFVETTEPLAAPGVLKKVIENTGKTCLAVNLNAEIYNYIFSSPRSAELIDFFMTGIAPETVETEIYDILDQVSDQIISWTPEWICLSLMVFDTQWFARWLAYFIRQKSINAKIVVGGPGCHPSAAGGGDFVPDLFRKNLIDYHVFGDGEISLAELLKGNIDYPGINGIPPRSLSEEDLENIPFPDYSDYQLDQFHAVDDRSIAINSSRGCVRKCTFCDYIEAHPKYVWRKAKSVFNEMLYQNSKFGITNFNFTDSLVNGNVREFNQLITLLADHNGKNPKNKLTWSGYYIFRNKANDDEWLWSTLRKSGAQRLAVGIEHFSQRVRYHIGKKFDDDSIIHHLKLAQKNKITIFCLMLVGYPTETADDVATNINWIKNNTQFNDTVWFSFSGVQIIANTQLDRRQEELGIEWKPLMFSREAKKTNWEVKSTFNNFENREKIQFEYFRLVREHGFGVAFNATSGLWKRYQDSYEDKKNETL